MRLNDIHVLWSNPLYLNSTNWTESRSGVYVVFQAGIFGNSNKAVYIGRNTVGSLGNRINDHRADGAEVQRIGGEVLMVTYAPINTPYDRAGAEAWLHSMLQPIIQTQVSDFTVAVNPPPGF